MNKRTLKKKIRQVCGDLAAEILIARHIMTDIDNDVVTRIITDIADLQCETISNATFSFDKSMREFDNMAEFRKARSKYNRKAFHKLNEDLRNRVTAIVKDMNATVPVETRKSAMAL